MNPFILGAVREPQAYAIPDRLVGLIKRVRSALRPEAEPEAFREYDPRKADAAETKSVTPSHLIGGGGRAEFFKLPRD